MNNFQKEIDYKARKSLSEIYQQKLKNDIKLDEDNFVELIIQMAASGDIYREIHENSGERKMLYKPYRDVNRLSKRNELLEKQLSKVKELLDEL